MGIIKKPLSYTCINHGEESMSAIKKTSTADHVDNHKRLVCFAMFLLSLIYAVGVIKYVADEEVVSYLGILGKGLAGLFFVVLIVSIYWKVRFIPENQRHLFSSPDSYGMQALNRACMISWVLTFVCLSLIKLTISKDSSTFPAEFYLNLTVFVMLAVFSVTFFFLFRTDREEEIAGQAK